MNISRRMKVQAMVIVLIAQTEEALEHYEGFVHDAGEELVGEVEEFLS